jgi:hypothetical protein
MVQKQQTWIAGKMTAQESVLENVQGSGVVSALDFPPEE